MQKKIKSFDGVKINYEVSGKNENCLVFLHGLGGDLNAWKNERKFFKKKNISTIAIDLRGHGKSERPKSYESYGLDKFAMDVYFVLKKKRKKKFILVWHCFGGIVSMNFYCLFPKMAGGYGFIGPT